MPARNRFGNQSRTDFVRFNAPFAAKTNLNARLSNTYGNGVPVFDFDFCASSTSLITWERYESLTPCKTETLIDPFPLIDPAKYIIRVANNLNFDEKAKRKALDILEQARKKNILAGKDPTGIAASILYIVNLEGQNVPKTQAEIAKAAGVTEVTVRNRSKELRKTLGIRRVTSGRTT